MGWLVQPLLFFLARCTRNQLIRNIEFLKTENEILRKRFVKHHVIVSQEDRDRLIKLGEQIGPDLKRMITIVRYDTYLRWVRNHKGLVSTKRSGRPKKPDEIRQLVLKIAQETGWGYTRVLGQLRRLGIMDISRQTIVNILQQAGHDPGPKRGPGTWDELLKMHAETLWQCDFFSKRVFSRLGMPQLFAMVFLERGDPPSVDIARHAASDRGLGRRAGPGVPCVCQGRGLKSRPGDSRQRPDLQARLRPSHDKGGHSGEAAGACDLPISMPTSSGSSSRSRSSAWITSWSSVRSILTTWCGSTLNTITTRGRTRGWAIS